MPGRWRTFGIEPFAVILDFKVNAIHCLPSVSKLILQRLPKPPCGYLLAIDRTNWQFGRKDINFLVIAIVVGNVSIPLVWKVLPERTKGGNSNVSQRIDLMEQLLKHLDPGEIHALTMDREFTGKRWLQWLDQNEIAYVLRIKSNTVVGKHLAREHLIGQRLHQPRDPRRISEFIRWLRQPQFTSIFLV